MTKFLAYYPLRPIHDTKELLGISKDAEEGNIIATLGRNIIIIIGLVNQKEIRSWTVLDKLSSKVVFDKTTNKYVAVFGNRSIRCWDMDVQDLNKVKKLKFHKNIIDIIATEMDEPILLYSDGTCESLSFGIASRKEKSTLDKLQFNVNEEISDLKLFYLHNNKERLLTYFLKQKQIVKLVTILLNVGDLRPLQSPKVFNLTRQKGIQLSGYTIVEGQNYPSLITIWSDKRVFMLTLDEKSVPQDSPGNFVSMIDLLNVTNPLSIIGLSTHCVAIYGANNTQEEGGSLILFNTQYKVIKAKQFFKIYFDFSRLWIVDNYILLAMGQNLSVVTFKIGKELLSDMIGSQFTNDNNISVGDDFINEDFELVEKLSFSPESLDVNLKNISKIKEEVIDDFDSKLKLMADGKTVPFMSYSSFEEKFKNLCSNNLDIEVLETNAETNDGFKINLMSNCNDCLFSLDEIEIIYNDLKRCGASEQEISEKLLTLLIKVDLIDDIATCLRKFTNISEKMLVKVLKFALKDSTIENYKNHVADDTNLNAETPKETINLKKIKQNNDLPNLDLLLDEPKKTVVLKKADLIDIILSCSFDEHIISRYIRKEIDLEEVLVLMQHLYNMITANNICLEERAETSIEFDDDLKILHWFGILLNTHFQKLILSRDLNFIELLLKWHEVLTEYKKDLISLTELSSLLYNLVDKKPVIKENKCSKWYSIEDIELF